MKKVKGTCLIVVAVLLSMVEPLQAVENGTGIYLLGSRGPYAGYMPGEGVYWQNDLYHYDGRLKGGRRLPAGGKIITNIESDAWINLLGINWSTGDEFLGGKLVLGAVLPYGNVEVDAEARLDPVNFDPISRRINDEVSAFGDPLLSSTLGWREGSVHWATTALLNVPIGDYQEGGIANVAFNRWALDVSASLSWINMKTGTEFSLVPGVTFNGENDETDYESGDEFHLEWSATQALNSWFSLGAVGYYYDQISGDSGGGAFLGEYEGRVSAVGGTIALTIGDSIKPFMIRVKALSEYDARNRAEGDAFFLTVSSKL